MVGDWYHPQSIDVLAKFQSFKSEGFEVSAWLIKRTMEAQVKQ